MTDNSKSKLEQAIDKTAITMLKQNLSHNLISSVTGLNTRQILRLQYQYL